MDEQIINLINQRKEVSLRIQEKKIQVCVPRVDLKREAEVCRHYTDQLGPHGVGIASSILFLSRDISC